MKSLGHRLLDEIEIVVSGSGDTKSMDKAIGTAQELLENLYILRYKAYEQGVLNTPSSPEFDLTQISEDLPMPEESKESFPPPIEEPETSSQEVHETPDLFSEQSLQIDSEQAEQDVNITEAVVPQENNMESAVEVPFDLEVLLHEAKGKHEIIDKFNGNYSLKEKITFINELFEGSSDSFASAVKQIDACSSLDALIPTLNFLSSTHKWGTSNKDAVQKFLEKVVAKYAA